MSQKRNNGSEEYPRKKKRTDNEGIILDSSTRPTTIGEAGIIESISLENFMCHNKLHFAFAPNVNFIIGRNGSGKSAILTGLVLGLGGKANATNRGTSVKGFVKNGKNFSVIEVKLHNRGPEAFRPEDYGSIITIERRITLDGSSTYKLRNENGRVVANKKEELTRILDQFNIQVDNPIAVLNQETSRNFLNSTSGRDKYKFFIKATQLEDIMDHYKNALEKQSLAKDRLEVKQEMLPTLKKEMKVREREYSSQQYLAKQRDQIDHLRKEFVWSLVIAKEKDVDDGKESLEKLKVELSKVNENQHNIEESIQKVQNKKDETEQQLQKIVDEMNEIKPVFTQLKQEDAALKQEKRNKELSLRRIKGDLNSINSEQKELSNKIKELKSAGNQDYTQERQQREEKLEKLESERAELQSKLTTTDNSFEQLKGSVKHYESELFNHKQEERNLHRQIENSSRLLANFEASRTNRFRKYGAYIPDVLKNIEMAARQGKFKKVPKGPVGAFVEVKDKAMALAIECAIGGILSAFCCDNHQDEKVLLEIFRKTIMEGNKPPVVVSQYAEEIYDVQQHAVQSNTYKSVLESIVISDPVIANCLIDQCEIESVLLIPHSPTARQLMMRNPPPNCGKTYTAEGDLIYPAPNFRFYASNKTNVRYLTSTVEDQIKELKKEISNFTSQKEPLVQTIKESQKILAQNSKECRATETQLNKIRQRINRLNLEINELKNIEDPEPPNFAILEEELEELDSKVISYEQKFFEVQKVFDEVKEKYAELQGKISEFKIKSGNFHETCDPLKEKHRKQVAILESLTNGKIANEKEIQEWERKITAAQNTLVVLEREVKVLADRTESVCERVESQKSSKTIERELMELQKHVEHEEKTRGSKEETLARFMEAKEQYNSIKYQIEQYLEIIDIIKASLDRRIKALKLFRTQMEIRIKCLFLTSLTTRNYKGKIVINHKKESLELFVQPSQDIAELNTDMRSLSGGERSFSTVCFILALWDAMESPFRILDEYDVFMDMVNRRMSMALMLETAYENSNHQFIFLTPLEMPIEDKEKRARICMMSDPERGGN